MFIGIELLFIYSHDNGNVFIFARSRQNDFFAPASIWLIAFSFELNFPVASTTMSIPHSFHGSSRVPAIEQHNMFSVDNQAVVSGLNFLIVFAVNCVILYQMSKRFRG